MYELQARYDSRASFYGKAHVYEENGATKLQSYDTHVASIKDGRALVHGLHSATTLRHIKEFLLQHGFEAGTKAQIEKNYMAVTV